MDHIEKLVEEEDRIIGWPRVHKSSMALQSDAEGHDLPFDPRSVQLRGRLSRRSVTGIVRGSQPGYRQRGGWRDLTGEPDALVVSAKLRQFSSRPRRQRAL